MKNQPDQWLARSAAALVALFLVILLSRKLLADARMPNELHRVADALDRIAARPVLPTLGGTAQDGPLTEESTSPIWALVSYCKNYAMVKDDGTIIPDSCRKIERAWR